MTTTSIKIAVVNLSVKKKIWEWTKICTTMKVYWLASTKDWQKWKFYVIRVKDSANKLIPVESNSREEKFSIRKLLGWKKWKQF